MQAKILSFGVRNLRSFGPKEQLIDIKPVNILVGRNSCGKSTFLRSFPLLRQSVESDTRSPILWYAGYGGYVDFGDFKTSLHDGQRTIYFDFLMRLDISKTRFTKSIHGIRKAEITKAATDDIFNIEEIPRYSLKDVKLELSLSNNKDELESRVIVEAYGVKASLSYMEQRVTSLTAIVTESGQEFVYPANFISEKGSVIPRGVWALREVKVKDSFHHTIDHDAISRLADKNIAELIGQGAIKSKRVMNDIVSLEFFQASEVRSTLLKSLSDSNPLKQALEENTPHAEKVLGAIRANLLMKNIEIIWAAADNLLKLFYGGVRYLGPLRASAERFYRFQDLQVNEIDHTGANLPMLINSLNWRQRKGLSDWVLENFGFSLELQLVGSHYALRIKEEGEKEFHNISDMGFGYSQILPVIVSVWREIVNGDTEDWRHVRGRSINRTLVIEQPELHLHPALQYKFGLAIAKVAALGKKRGYNFVIETHSKHLIDALGESIRNDDISADDVSIGLFEKNETGRTLLSFSKFDTEGYLTNWPTGFLSPEL